MVRHPNGRFLYAANEDITPEGIDRITAFAIDAASPGSLKALGSVSSHGSAPCHLSIDASGKWLFVANFFSGTVAVYPIRADGRLGDATQVIRQEGSGLPPPGQKSNTLAHEMVPTPDGKFLLSVNLGANRIYVYRFDAAAGRLSAHTPAWIALPAGSGPRHLVFSKDARFVYVMTELSADLITLHRDAGAGTLTQLAVTPTLPDTYKGKKSGAEIMLHPGTGALQRQGERIAVPSPVMFMFDSAAAR